MTRRELLLGLGVTSILAGKKKIERTRLSAIGDEIGPALPEQIAFLKQYGLNTVELREIRLQSDGENTRGGKGFDRLTPEEWKEVRSRFSDAGIRITFLNSGLGKSILPGTIDQFASPLSPTSDLGKLPPDERGAAVEKDFGRRLDRLKRCMEAGDALGCKWIRVFAYRRVKDPLSLFPRIAESLEEMAETAQSGGFTLLLENEGSTNVGTAEELAEMAKRVKAKNLALCWDPQNAITMEQPFPANYKPLPKKRIWDVQLKADGLVGDPAKRVDWGSIMQALVDDGYKGQFTLETHKGRGPSNFEYAHRSMREMFRLIGEPLPPVKS